MTQFSNSIVSPVIDQCCTSADYNAVLHIEKIGKVPAGEEPLQFGDEGAPAPEIFRPEVLINCFFPSMEKVPDAVRDLNSWGLPYNHLELDGQCVIQIGNDIVSMWTRSNIAICLKHPFTPKLLRTMCIMQIWNEINESNRDSSFRDLCKFIGAENIILGKGAFEEL